MGDRTINHALLPSEGPPQAAPLGLAVYSREEAPATPAPVSVEEIVPQGDLQIVDPPGRSVTVDDRVMTEAMMCRFGMQQQTTSQMAGMLGVSTMWMARVLRTEGWLYDAYKAGVTEARRERAIKAELALDKALEGYELEQEKVTKDGDVVPYMERVGPSGRAAEFVLSTLARDVYGKDAAPVERAVSVTVMVGINDRLRSAGEAEVRVE